MIVMSGRKGKSKRELGEFRARGRERFDEKSFGSFLEGAWIVEIRPLRARYEMIIGEPCRRE